MPKPAITPVDMSGFYAAAAETALRAATAWTQLALTPWAALAKSASYGHVAASSPAPYGSPSSTARSWYRAPYKSPFDPMFWLSPGSAVDHWPASALTPWLYTWPVQPIAPAALFSPTGGNPSAGALAPVAFPWLMFAPWLQAGAEAPSNRASRGNVVDFGEAYSQYRSAGGHAVAQIHGSPAADAVRSVTLAPSPAMAWMALMWPWMAR